jgi:hypothetical protein
MGQMSYDAVMAELKDATIISQVNTLEAQRR